MLEILIPLVLVLAAITLLGHGLWVLIAAGVRAIRGEEPPPLVIACPHCGHRHPLVRLLNGGAIAPCPACGLRPSDSPAVKEGSDYQAFRRHLDRLRAAGLVDDALVQSLAERSIELNRPQTIPLVSEPARVPDAPREERSPHAEIVTAWVIEPEEPRAAVPVLPAKAVAPVVSAAPPVAPVAAVVPTKPWFERVAEFLEERNIRLGEIILVLVGGLLIVGGSVAVVISFWNELESYLKFSVFVALSSAAFGLGLLTYHRWKLEITGRAWLTIATLLAPLNFLAMASLSREEWSPVTAVVEIAALAIFTWLVRLASRVLVPRSSWELPLAVVGNAAAVLVVARLPGLLASATMTFVATAAAVLVFVAAVGRHLWKGRGTRRDAGYAAGLLALLGAAAFSLAVPLGLAVARVAQQSSLGAALQTLSPLLAAAAIPTLLAGLAVMRQCSRATETAPLRTTGTAIACFAVGVMAAAVLLAWPQPTLVLAVGAINAATLATVAFRRRLPFAHAGAIASAALAYLVAFYLTTGQLALNATGGSRQLLEQLLGPRSGSALVALVAVLALAAEGLRLLGLHRHARQYGGGAGIVAGLSLVLVAAHVFGTGRASHLDTAIVCGAYGLGSLVVSARWQWRPLFAVGQVLLTFSALSGVTAWLETNPFGSARLSRLDPRSLHSYGLGLAGLSLAWLVARLVGRVVAPQREARWPRIDRGVGLAVVPLQLLLALAAGPAFEPTAWWLLAVLALSSLASLWVRWKPADAAAAIALVATVPWLAAGLFLDDLASATAIRWIAAGTFLVGATAVSARGVLAAAVRTLGARLETAERTPGVCRAILLATTAAPVVLLTLVAAGLEIGGIHGGPMRGFFATLTPQVAYLVPLGLVTLALTLLAVREASPGYAFIGGMVAELGVVLAALLPVFLEGRWPTSDEYALALQYATIAAAVWAIAWIAVRPWVAAWREKPSQAALALMDIQLGLSQLGNVALILPAVLALTIEMPEHRWPMPWTVAAGAWWGWAALALAALAALLRTDKSMTVAIVGRTILSVTRETTDRIVRPTTRTQEVRAGAVFLVATVAVGLAACTVRRLLPEHPEFAYRALMLGWAGAAAVFVAVARGLSVPSVARRLGMTRAGVLHDAGPAVAAAVLLAVALGMKAAFVHGLRDELPWAAGAIALASAAAAAMAIWRRRDDWALAAALGVNLAASLLVWYVAWFDPRTTTQWKILFVQANIAASAAATLAWLAVRQWLNATVGRTILSVARETTDKIVRPTTVLSPELRFQAALAPLGLFLLLLPALGSIIASPAAVPNWLANIASPAGWIAAALTIVSTAWAVGVASADRLGHVLGGAAAAMAVLLACFAGTVTAGRDWPEWLLLWPEYHTLMIAWGTLALVVLAAGAGGGRLPTSPRMALSARAAECWVVGLAAAAAALSVLHANGDPASPWWSIAAIALAGLAFAGLGLWRERDGYKAIAGLALNLAACVLCWVWQSDVQGLPGLVAANVLALGAAALVWGLIERGPWRSSDCRVPHGFALAALTLLGGLVGGLLNVDLADQAREPIARLGWFAVAAVAVGFLPLLGDRKNPIAWPGLFLTAMFAHGLSLVARDLAPLALVWSGTWELAAVVLALAAAARLLERLPAFTDDCQNGVLVVQSIAAALAAVLSVYVSIRVDFDALVQPLLHFPYGRLAGPLVTALLLPAAVISARRMRTWQGVLPRLAAVVLGLLFLAELGWALLRPEAATWIHRAVVLHTAAVAMVFIAAFAVPRLAPRAELWIETGKRSVPVLAVLALVALAVVLGLEVRQYVPYVGAGLAMPAVVIVAVALAALFVACIAMAVAPRFDPLGLSDRGRQAYVYAAEVLALIVAVHLRLTVPDLFRLHIMAKYWMLMVLAAAFLGAGLSELFHRRGLPVLSIPLERTAMLLPLAPAIGFWFVPAFENAPPLAGADPSVWLLAAAFYGMLAVTRWPGWQAAVFSLAGLAAANVGLAVFWAKHDWAFLQNPQLWLIPVGLSILAAEHLNRRWLSPQQRAGVRYLALSAIYLPLSLQHLGSIGHSLWLPLTLVLFSLAGVLVGIVFRVRSFLYLGVTFLTLVVVTMVRYAAVDLRLTWVFYLCLIALGSAVIALVALYENRREAILAALKRFKQWQE